MALEALWLQSETYPARLDRVLIESLLTEGVLDVAGGELLVRQRAAGANMSVEIDPGRVAITGDDQANQGRYLGRSTEVETRTIAAAPTSGSRIDLVVARVADASVTGAVNGLLLEVITGTVHATTPVAPAVPNGAVPLARVAVAAGQVSVVTANINAAVRPQAFVAGGSRGLVGYFDLTVTQTGITTTHQWGQVEFRAVAGRAYEVKCGALVSSTVNGDSAVLELRVDADVLAGSNASDHMEYAAGTSGYWLERSAIFLPSSSATRNALSTLARGVGTGTLTVNEFQSYISVTDLGVL